MIRVILPHHLQFLAGVGKEVKLEVAGQPTLCSVLDALEAAYPVLRGTIRDSSTKERRDLLRFFVCGEDWSHQSAEVPLPQAVTTGQEPLIVLGAIAGG